MSRIAIVGLDLVGTSLGLALKDWLAKQKTDSSTIPLQIAGFDYDPDRQKRAEKLGAIDKSFWGLPSAIEDAAVIIVTGPLEEASRTIAEIIPLINWSTVITTTNPRIADTLQIFNTYVHKEEQISFVAGHPMISLAREGSPSKELFRGLMYGVFPHSGAKAQDIDLVVGIVHAIGAKAYFADPTEYDSQFAATSLLPAMLVAILARTVRSDSGWQDISRFSQTDLEQIAKFLGPFPEGLATDAQNHAKDLKRWLERYHEQLGALIDSLDRDNQDTQSEIRQLLEQANQVRQEWGEKPGREATETTGLQDFIKRMFVGRRNR